MLVLPKLLIKYCSMLTKKEASSVLSDYIDIYCTISTGVRPFLSTILRSAPLISKCLTDLELFRSSAAFIARCKGVSPFESTALTSDFHASKYATDDSAL